jgi:hypothetical protein
VGSASRKAATYINTEKTQTSMPWVGFELTIPAFERAKAILRPRGHTPVLNACNRICGKNFAYLSSLRTCRSYKRLQDQLRFEFLSRKIAVRLILVDDDGNGDLSQGWFDLRGCWDWAPLNFGDKNEIRDDFQKSVRMLHLSFTYRKSVGQWTNQRLKFTSQIRLQS